MVNNDKQITFRITVKSIKRNFNPTENMYLDRILTFHNVKEYKVIDGFVVFTDSKTGAIKRFHGSNVELEEEVTL